MATISSTVSASQCFTSAISTKSIYQSSPVSMYYPISSATIQNAAVFNNSATDVPSEALYTNISLEEVRNLYDQYVGRFGHKAGKVLLRATGSGNIESANRFLLREAIKEAMEEDDDVLEYGRSSRDLDI